MAESSVKTCERLRKLDREYHTDRRSPLHHDNRWCPVHSPRPANSCKECGCAIPEGKRLCDICRMSN